MMHWEKLEEYAPFILMILMFMWQNNVFVRPEQLEKKHREILENIEKSFGGKFVELNAYKEFQSHIYSELEKVTTGIDDLKSYLMDRGKA